MTAETATSFPIRLTADFFLPDGSPRYRDIGLDVLADRPQIRWEPFAEHHTEIAPSQIGDARAVLVLSSRVTAQSLAAGSDLLAIVRFGVGYDSVDVAACTAADVAVVITPGAVDRPVAEATVGWMLALTHHVRMKDLLVRRGEWDARSRYMGCELRDRTLGVVGLGGIGREVVRLLAGFGMRQPLAFDPFLSPEGAADAGVRLVSLDELLAESDFVSLHCPLNDATRGLIGDRELRRMKPASCLINTARGGIVDEDALYAALKEGRIAGAAIDCFAVEPLVGPSRFADLDNVLLAPHSIAWTEELFRDIGRTAFRAIVDLSEGREPRGTVNREIYQRPSFRQKWSRLIGGGKVSIR